MTAFSFNQKLALGHGGGASGGYRGVAVAGGHGSCPKIACQKLWYCCLWISPSHIPSCSSASEARQSATPQPATSGLAAARLADRASRKAESLKAAVTASCVALNPR